ncbi:MAG TPA: tetratricopeptide repeat protein [Thiothrix sp.]|nr:tetratricopeptide repeat protein [Thiothrix sp.]
MKYQKNIQSTDAINALVSGLGRDYILVRFYLGELEMQIVRWFMSHPIIAAWALAGLAVVLNVNVGGGHKDDKHIAATDETATSADHQASASTKSEADQTTTAAGATSTASTDSHIDKTAIGAVPQAPKAPEAPTVDKMPVPASVVALSGTATNKTTHETTTNSTVATPKATAVTTTAPEASAEVVKAEVPAAPVTETTKVAPTAPAVPVAPVSAPKVVATPTTPTAPVNTPTETAVPEQTATVTSTPVAEPKMPEAPVQASAPATPATPVIAATTPVVTSTPVAQKAVVSVAPTAPTAAAAAAITNKPAPTGFEGKTPAELLQQARIAFNQKELDKSVAIYQQLIKQQPNVIEYKGELGNVFYHQNKPKEAAALYAEIALPLIQQGKSNQAANMLGFIGAFYPEKAAEISKHLMVK